ncbi:MAG: formylglycine-generating enzyme family protein [Alphaproteobacteria bacterium]|nr:formylglycine-generating enzyme family protein [Alphaproteobacteria bacterium]
MSGGGCNGYFPHDEGWGRGRRPVINVSWYDAQAYVDWLSRRSGQRYRLLSEAEWEYATRAGTTSRYWLGNGIDHRQANLGGRLKSTAAAGSYGANPFGLFDVHGNLWEWVEDCANQSYAGAPNDGSAWSGPSDCPRRMLRGGSWTNPPDLLRSAYRADSRADDRSATIGFRVARDP